MSKRGRHGPTSESMSHVSRTHATVSMYLSRRLRSRRVTPDHDPRHGKRERKHGFRVDAREDHQRQDRLVCRPSEVPEHVEHVVVRYVPVDRRTTRRAPRATMSGAVGNVRSGGGLVRRVCATRGERESLLGRARS